MNYNAMRLWLPIVLVAGIALVLALTLTGCSDYGLTETPTDTSTDDGSSPDTEIHEDDSEDGDDATPAYDGSQDPHLVVTQAEPVTGNSAWCGTMQLCWNSLVDEMNHGEPALFVDKAMNTTTVDHMNDRLFATGDLSEDHYCTYAGPMTYDAKREIEKEISDRFDQKSDILDSLTEWSDDPDTTTKLLYAMIYRKFSFGTPFGVREDGWFGGTASDHNRAQRVTYFEAKDDDQRDQVTPLFYEDYDRHAVSIATEEGDEVILVRSPEGKTFDEIWENAMERADKATAEETRPLDDDESFLCPNIDIDLAREYKEWEGGTLALTDAKGNQTPYTIAQALQTLKLSLDNEGGEVKSEAAIVALKAAGTPFADTTRHFDYSDTFALFVRDGNAGDDARPYVAVLVDDITMFQDGAEKA
jgi:hypothetical protein